MAATGQIGSAGDTIAAWLRDQEKKDLLRFVTIGSVDDGKSTLIGRLLHDAHGLYEDQLNAVRRASVKGSTRGAGSTAEIDFSLVTDGLLAEREQGITIDVAYRYFATGKRKFIIADTPGHVQYTRNMATGASTADVAIILVDARTGVVAQTRRHAHIAALLGIPHVVACVNKMDLVGFDRSVFETIRTELDALGSQLGVEEVLALPVSALGGDNVVTRSERSPWWEGPTLLDYLETVVVHDRRTEGALRFPVQLVLRPGINYRGFAGQVVSGVVRPGDEVVALPSGKRTRVAAVEASGKEVPEAFAPMSVALRLTEEIDISRGDMLAHPSAAPRSTTDLEANLVWMSERRLDPGKSYLLKHTTRMVRAEVTEIIHGTDPTTLQPVEVEGLGLNDIARVRVRCRAPIFVDAYARNRATGAFILIDSVSNDTVAAGMIAEAEPARETVSGDASARTQVSRAERRARLDQDGAVVRVFAPTGEAARDLGYILERELFDRGRVATVIESGGAPLEAAEACARAGLVAILPLRGEGLAVEVDGESARDDDPEGLAGRAVRALESKGVFDAG
jgi:bifunctional enzyme CysN/CysC